MYSMAPQASHSKVANLALTTTMSGTYSFKTHTMEAARGSVISNMFRNPSHRQKYHMVHCAITTSNITL